LNPGEFAAVVVLVSASGVLSPGPLFFANIIYGSKMGITAGIKIAYGHTMVELPLIIILAFGLFAFSYVFLDNENLKIISFVGGISIISFASTQIINVTKGKVDHNRLIWWFTIGLNLISDSIHFFGLVNGILILFSSHIWMDYAWLIITSYLIYRGTSVLKTKFYSLLLISISTVLVFYGVYIILRIF
jgi:threonine/homoserine/homoserine lactone efflux protein